MVTWLPGVVRGALSNCLPHRRLWRPTLEARLLLTLGRSVLWQVTGAITGGDIGAARAPPEVALVGLRNSTSRCMKQEGWATGRTARCLALFILFLAGLFVSAERAEAQTSFGYTTAGATRYTVTADNKQGSKFTLLEAGVVDTIYFWAKTGGGAEVPEVVKGIIYQDNSGVPGAWVSTTQEITINGTAQWWAAPFSSAVSLSAGTYWLVVHSGTKTDMYGDAGATNQRAYNGDLYFVGVGAAVFTGIGLDDATSGGTYAGAADATFTIIIDGTGAPDTFKWQKDAGSFTTGVAITGSAQTLQDGVTVTFTATTGHTLDDQWTIDAGVSPGPADPFGSATQDNIKLSIYATYTPSALSLSSAASQTFTVGNLTTAISTLTVTDSGTPGITAANDIRIRIPATFNMSWDTLDVTATIGGGATSKVSGAVSYEDAGKTLVVDVTTDFAGADQIIISDLSFRDFTAPSSADNLELELNNDGAVSATDIETITILAAVPATLSSAANQAFIVDDPPAAISTQTVTDDTGTPTITAANDIRVRIPTTFNMIWDTLDVTATIGGGATSKVSSTVSYEDGGKTLVVDVTTDFAAGDEITISDLSFRDFTALSSADNLELEVNNDGVVSATDDKTITITSPPVILSSAANQTFSVGDPPTAISTQTVSGSPAITAVNDIRLRIPAGFEMRWDTLDLTATIGGGAASKVSGAVSYEDGGKTLVVDVTTDLAANDTVTISDLSFTSFLGTSPADNLELEVNNDGVVSATDDKTITIDALGETFGYPTAGGTRYSVFADNKQGSKFTLSEAGAVDSIYFWGKLGGGAGDPKEAKLAIYQDNAGSPGALVATTPAVTVTSTRQWYAAGFSSPVSLSAGTYWLVAHSATKLDMYGDAGSTNQRAYNGDTYSDGPADPFGAATQDNIKLSIYATYSPITQTFGVAVTPDTTTASRLPSNGTNYTVDFTVTNNGSDSDDFDLLTTQDPGAAISVVSIMGTGVTQDADPDSARVANLAAGDSALVTVTYSVADVAAGTSDTLLFTARSVGDPATSDNGRLELTVIKPNMTTAKSVSPSGTQVPGTDLTYTISITNNGSDDAVTAVIVDSLAVEVEFKVGSVVNSLPTGVSIAVEYSDDDGGTWTYTPVSGGCGAPVNYDGCVNRIRWRLLDNLSSVPPNNTGSVEFVARIK